MPPAKPVAKTPDVTTPDPVIPDPAIDNDHNNAGDDKAPPLRADENEHAGLTRKWQAFTSNGTPFNRACDSSKEAVETLAASQLTNGYLLPVFVVDED